MPSAALSHFPVGIPHVAPVRKDPVHRRVTDRPAEWESYYYIK